MKTTATHTQSFLVDVPTGDAKRFKAWMAEMGWSISLVRDDEDAMNDVQRRSEKPYTIEELVAGVEESERQYAAGEYYTQEETHELMEQFVRQQAQTA